MDKELLQRLDSWIAAHQEEMLEDLKALIAIPSKRGEAAEGAPFGAACAQALDAGLALCEKYGFATKNYDYYAGAADMGAAPPRLDILAHLDVVDEGTGWDTDPYTLTLQEGRLYGRGTSDDKGPAIAALYAMRAVRDLGLPLTGNVRLILGTDEECGSSDLHYYFQREVSAPHSFSPDAEFPLYNAEKGFFRPKLTADLAPETALPRVTALQSGTALNIVPALATATVLGLDPAAVQAACASMAADWGVELLADAIEGGCALTVKGISAHASTPEEGRNALTALLGILSALPLADIPSTRLLQGLCRLFPHGDCLGKALGVAQADEVFGPLTLSFDQIRLEDGAFTGAWDSRVPGCATWKNCADVALQALEPLGLTVDIQMTPVHYVPAESPFVQTLLAAYEAVTGQKGKCLSMGGGTYVHDIEGGVAFGPVMPGIQTNIHGANEFIPLDDLLAGCKIFALAIAEICK